jgi:hypothetical protein
VPAWAQAGGRVTLQALLERRAEATRGAVQRSLEARRPLGTKLTVGWARYKKVSVSASVVVDPEEDRNAVQRRIVDRLHDVINPLSTPDTGRPCWRFGQPLHISNIYRICLEEPGATRVRDVKMIVEDAPAASAESVVADAYQSDTWFAAAGKVVYRSLNAGKGWERVPHDFEGEKVTLVRTPALEQQLPGHVAVVVAGKESGGEVYDIHLSRDLGDTFERVVHWTGRIRDVAFVQRGRELFLMFATPLGLQYIDVNAAARQPQNAPVINDPSTAQPGVFAVLVHRFRGQEFVVVACDQRAGVLVSPDAGAPGSFRPLPIGGNRWIRTLAVQRLESRSFLWGGEIVQQEDPGQGVHRWEFRADGGLGGGWTQFVDGWDGQSCLGLAAVGHSLYAASYSKGILVLDTSRPQGARWRVPSLESGLPTVSGEGRRRVFQEIKAVAAAPDGVVMAATEKGVYRRIKDAPADTEREYENCSALIQSEEVTVPPSWLLCSGEHQITTEYPDESA